MRGSGQGQPGRDGRGKTLGRAPWSTTKGTDFISAIVAQTDAGRSRQIRMASFRNARLGEKRILACDPVRGHIPSVPVKRRNIRAVSMKAGSESSGASDAQCVRRTECQHFRKHSHADLLHVHDASVCDHPSEDGARKAQRYRCEHGVGNCQAGRYADGDSEEGSGEEQRRGAGERGSARGGGSGAARAEGRQRRGAAERDSDEGGTPVSMLGIASGPDDARSAEYEPIDESSMALTNMINPRWLLWSERSAPAAWAASSCNRYGSLTNTAAWDPVKEKK